MTASSRAEQFGEADKKRMSMHAAAAAAAVAAAAAAVAAAADLLQVKDGDMHHYIKNSCCSTPHCGNYTLPLNILLLLPAGAPASYSSYLAG